MVNAKIILVGTSLAVLAAALSIVLVMLNNNSNGQFYLQATTPEGGDLYLKLDADGVAYDIVKKVPIGNNQDALNLERFYYNKETNEPVYASVLLDPQTYEIMKFPHNDKFWKSRTVENYSAEVTITKGDNEIVVTVAGDTRKIVLDASGTPTLFADMPVKQFSFDTKLFDARPTTLVPNPTEATTFVVPPNDPVTKADNANNIRLLNDLMGGRSLNDNAPSTTYACASEMAETSYSFGGNKVANGNCGGYNTIAFQGTNPAEIGDLWSDIQGVWDNFDDGFNHVDFASTGTYVDGYGSGGVNGHRYELCTGHSLGGAIAKNAANRGMCDRVVTCK